MLRDDWITKEFILIILINYCAGSVIFKKDAAIKSNSRIYGRSNTVSTDLNKSMESKPLHDSAIEVLNKSVTTIRNFLLNSIHNIISLLPNPKINEIISEPEHTNEIISEPAHVPKHSSARSFYSNFSDTEQIQFYLEPNGEAILSSMNYDYVDSVENVTSEHTHAPSFSNGSSIHEILNGTQSNRSHIYPMVPVCRIGHGNCTKCQDISPYCHYMYSESRCVYYNSTHASSLYECGERWFSMDGSDVFFATIAILLIASSAITGYFIWLQYHMESGVSADILAAEEYEAMRNVVEVIREKRTHEKETCKHRNLEDV